MKKGLIALIVAAMLAVLAAVPAMAADGINASEEELYSYFAAQVTSQEWLGAELQANYLSESKNALAQVDLDAAACNDLKGAVDAVMGILSANNVQSLSDAKAFRDAYLQAVNPVANKYSMNVSLDAVTGAATVTVTIPSVVPGGRNGSTTIVDTSAGVRQTGFGMVQTIIVIAAVLAVVAGAVVVIRRRKLFE